MVTTRSFRGRARCRQSWRAAGRAVLAGSCFSVTLYGCGGSRTGSEDEPAAEEPQTTLSVRNDHWADVTISVLRGGVRVRLGLVTSTNRVSFDLSQVVGGGGADLRFVADPVGGAAFLSEQVNVRPGDEVELRVANRLQQSSLSVWHGANIGVDPGA